MNTITVTYESVEITCYRTHYRVYSPTGALRSFKRLSQAKAFIDNAISA